MAEARERTLRDVAIGDTATVRRLNGEGAIKRHIMDMGITKGTSVFVRKVAPLGDPIEVTVRGYELSLRKSEAESIVVSLAFAALHLVALAWARVQKHASPKPSRQSGAPQKPSLTLMDRRQFWRESASFLRLS